MLLYPKFHELFLKEIILWIHLGCSAEERMQTQEVRINVCFRFNEMPAGTLSDKLNETICYAEVTQQLQKHCENQEYNLIEKIGFDAYQVCKNISTARAAVHIAVHKIKPPIQRLSGGSHYRCGDFLL